MTNHFPGERDPALFFNPDKAVFVQARLDTLPLGEYAPDGAYVISNDHLYDGAFTRAIANSPATENNRTRVGLIIGNGLLFSSAPEFIAQDKLNLDIVAMTDANSFMADWLDYSSEILLSVQTPDEYCATIWNTDKQICQNMHSALQRIIPRALLSTNPVKNWLGLEAVHAGNYHFLNNQARFEACQAAVEKLHRVDAILNLGDLSAIHVLANALSEIKGTITFANMTNVWEHGGTMLAGPLSMLPFHADSSIIYSSHIRPPQIETEPWARLREPEAKFCQSLNAYMKRAQRQLIRHTLMIQQRQEQLARDRPEN